jgi:uncharacterized membrane protein YjgN (DUF898 family)
MAKHTIIDHRRLSFNGNGTQLFGKFIIWYLLTIVTLGIYGFWLSIKLKKWVTEHTDGLGGGKSEFDGGLFGLIKAYVIGLLFVAAPFLILMAAITGITGIILPFFCRFSH